MKKALLFIVLFSSLAPFCLARENVDYWYIKDFQTEIIVNKNSTAKITERITADCGKAKKHGLFRAMPTKFKTKERTYYLPIRLISITDFEGKSIKYETIKKKEAIVWKIGDPDATVSGINKYKIIYEVGNVIRTENHDYDEFYWNVLGFWDLEIDNFSADIVFPGEANKTEVQVEYYTGQSGDKNKDLASYVWTEENKLRITSEKTLPANKAITLSVIFPKGVFSAYKFTFSQKYGKFLWLIVPFSVLLLCFFLWKYFGKELEIKKPVVTEFKVPENMPPAEMGLLYENGRFKPKFVTATIIEMAVRGIINIKEINKKFLVFKYKDYKLKKAGKEPTDEYEKAVLRRVFAGQNAVAVSSLKKRSGRMRMKFLREEILDIFRNKNLTIKKGRIMSAIFIICGIALIITSLWLFKFLEISQLSLSSSGLIFIVFSRFMPKRSRRGADLFRRIKGLNLYMKTAEKYRQPFYAKEQIFDKLLPSAVVFGLVKKWAKKIEKIYGSGYFKAHPPGWYSAEAGGLSASSFVSAINGVSSSISSHVSSGTGAGGGGSAGGGAGGGGGGGW